MTGDQQDDHQPQREADEHEAEDVAALRAELAAAKGISRWLYDRSPNLRLFLGDVSEWPWLVDQEPEDEAVGARLVQADLDLAVLRRLAAAQALAEDLGGAADLAGQLGFAPDQFDGALSRLIDVGHLAGGQVSGGIQIETVTYQGISAAGMLDRDGQPLLVLLTDLAAFTGAGYGTVRIPAGVDLEPGQTIVLTDVEAGVLDAKVLAIKGDRGEVRVFWDTAPRGRRS
jgi:hypothetical protein